MNIRLLGIAAALASAVAAYANVDVMTFEGLQNLEPIDNYYNGGTGGFGSGPGSNFGVSFASDSLAIISNQDGGTGNVGNLPSGDTCAFFLSGAGDTMNVASGFTTGFSFFYAAVAFSRTVNVYSGLDGTGALLATLNLPANGSVPGPDSYDVWTPVGVTFAGTAESAVFTGVANQIAFDNITIGSSTAGGSTPGPVAAIPFALGLFLKRRKS